jgi:hypothetical protein
LNAYSNTYCLSFNQVSARTGGGSAAQFSNILLDSDYFSGTGAFLSFANLKLNSLAIVQFGEATIGLDFRVVDEQISATIFRSNKTVAFVGVKPLYRTFTHYCNPVIFPVAYCC